MKNLKKILLVILTFFCVSFLGLGGIAMSYNSANAEQTTLQNGWINNYETTSRSGKTYTGTAIPIEKDGVIVWNTINTGYASINLPFKMNMNDLAGGLMFQIENPTTNKVGTDMSVIFRDSEDPSKVVSFIISCGEIPGVPMQVLYFTTNDDFYRVDGYGYYDQSYNNIWDAHKVNELGTRDYEPNVHYGIFVADGTDFTETTALKFGVGTDGLYYQGNKVSDLANSSMFPSGYVTTEVTLYNFFNMEENDCTKGYLNFISAGGKSLAEMTEDTVDLDAAWRNGYESTSRSGVTYKGTAVPIEKDGVIVWNTIDTGYSTTKLPFKVNIEDLAGGLMFQIDNPTTNKVGTDMSVIFRDSEDPSKVVSFIISCGEIPGVPMQVLYFTTNDDFYRVDGYGYYDQSYNNIWDAHKVNELGTRDYEPNDHCGVFVADGTTFTETTALKFGVGADGLYYQGSKVSDLANSSMFPSGYVTAEVTLYNFFNMEENDCTKGYINFISVGDRSLARMTEDMTEAPSKYTNDYTTKSRSGVTYTSTKVPLKKEGTMIWNTITTGYSNTVKLHASVDLIKEGFMFQLETPVGTRTGTDMAVAFRDSDDPTKVVRYIIGTGDRVGVNMNELHFDTDNNFNRRDGYGYYDGTEYGCILDAHKVNELGVRDYEPNVYYGVMGADGTDFQNTTALLFAVKDDGCYFQTQKKWDGINSSVFTSGYVTIEITVYNFGNGSDNEIKGSVNLISLGGRSLANMSDEFDSDAPDVEINAENYDETNETLSYFEDENTATLADLKSFALVTDENDVYKVDVSVYNINGVAYTGDSVTFAAGDYIVYNAYDIFDHLTSKRVEIEIVEVAYVNKVVDGVQASIRVELGSEYILQADEVEDKVFVGWEISDKLYANNHQIIVDADMSATAVYIEFKMLIGASVRLDAENPGIRWTVTLAEGDKAKVGDYATVWGMKITQVDREGYLNIETTKWVEDGDLEYRAAMTGITNNLDTMFNGIAYVKVTYSDGTKATIWAIENDNLRSISQVAALAYDEEPEHQEILEKLITISPNTVILLPANASETAIYAAELLNENLSKTLGYTLSVIKEGEGEACNYIALGNTILSQDSSLTSPDDLNDDGFVITRIGKNIFMQGENDYGLINAVNHFAEKYLGVEYLTIDYTKYGDVSRIIVKDIVSETSIPDFSMRDYFANQTMSSTDYAAKLGYESMYKFDATTNNEGVIAGGVHNLDSIIPYDSYPQFYLVEDSNKALDLTNGLNSSYAYDASNTSSMISVLLEKLKTAVLNDATGRYIILGLPDSGFVPTANNTSAITSKFGGFSGLYIHFCNVVAEQLNAWMVSQSINRDIRVVAVTYWSTSYYDQCSVNTNAYVDICLPSMFCQYHTIETSSSTCSACSEAKATFLGWKSKLNANSEIWVYNYATNFTHCLFWFNNFNALQTNVAYYKANGVNKILYQGHPHGYNYYQGNLENYIISKLLWDSSLNVDDLVYAYNASYYEDSASVVNTVYDNMNSYDAYLLTKLHADMYANEDTISTVYTKTRLETNINLIEDEITRVNALDTLTAEEKEIRVNRLLEVEVQLRYMILINWDSYYTSTDGETDYAIDLINSLELLGIQFVGEATSIGDLKNQYSIS